ncbi:hypothetical protein BJD99_18060 [Rhodococcus sp. 1163]|uniref:ABC transporter permease n=1 Tax=Rhodococcus sp. 1163 TaxID=1905289 RepID=UPI000A0C1A54|nr:ABC transporter permease [Rhodococcus sp. 1163]ORI18688.1 hypothetical protein BJD99_18060 [Rhodococcus sp. 1163]
MPHSSDHRHPDWDQAFGADTEAIAPAHILEHSQASAPAAGESRTAWRSVVEAMVFPIFFAVMFALCYVSAFHNPTPRNVEIVVTGPESSTSILVDQLASKVEGKFDLQTSTDTAAAIERLQGREIAGVIELGSPMTVHVASAEGPVLVQAVEGLTQPLAAAQGQPANIVDHAPLAPDDPTGQALFYLLVVSTIIGYLTITVLAQVAPAMKMRPKLGILAGMSFIGIALSYLVSSIFVGFYAASFVENLAMLAVIFTYTFTVGLVSILANKVFGHAAIMVVMLLMIFLNFPSAGAAIPVDFLPGFWSGVSNFWIGSGAMDAARSIVYFGSTGVDKGLFILGGWLVLTVALLVFTHRPKKTSKDVAAHAAH